MGYQAATVRVEKSAHSRRQKYPVTSKLQFRCLPEPRFVASFGQIYCVRCQCQGEEDGNHADDCYGSDHVFAPIEPDLSVIDRTLNLVFMSLSVSVLHGQD